MSATLGLAALRGAQFGIGAACYTAIAFSGTRDVPVAPAAASVGVVVGVAAGAFTLLSATFGPTPAPIAIRGLASVLLVTAGIVTVSTVVSLLSILVFARMLSTSQR